MRETEEIKPLFKELVIRLKKEHGIHYAQAARAIGKKPAWIRALINDRNVSVVESDIEKLYEAFPAISPDKTTDIHEKRAGDNIKALLELNELRKQKEEELDKEIEDLQKRNAELEEKLAFYKSIVERIEKEKK